ncbi:hypothetical protein [Mangrovivirga cuniculi]|uniref:Tetratricopeptide repeat-containing protein n=1 Tax=Mangrovivirga cuniculi TaxID=2715131 RepID=A0A4D7JND4_9BACT|nr:hypothetical protein [Mangrovivirga cuniculi]QCK16177.1 hypothetical protein DCC35_16215 [Mangrovivirga cuniculi]
MKKAIITSLMTILVFSVFGNEKFEKAMKKNIELVYSADSEESYQIAINNLTRIADAEPERWEPEYYIAFAYTLYSFDETKSDKKDALLAIAQQHLDKALNLAPEHAELLTLQGFIYTAKLSVDPATRGQKYSGMAMQKYNQALQQDPENPRALLMLGQMMYGTAQFMGSSTVEACETIGKSIEKFETYKTENEIAPTWGKGQAERAYQQCGE